MAMTRWERKAALPHGMSTAIANRLALSVGHVAQVVAGKRRDRRVEVAVARKLRRRVDEVFPPLEQAS